MHDSSANLPLPNPAAPRSVQDFHLRLTATAPTMPRRLRQCADYIAANTDRIAVSTVADLAAGADVPPSALMRFCQILGFTGFSDMQRLFRDDYSPGWPSYTTRLANLKGASGSPPALLAEFIEAGRASLESLAKTADETALIRAVDLLASAQTIHIIGLRRSFPVACYLAYVFEQMSVPAMLHDAAGLLDHRFALRPGDALIAITFAPGSAETLALATDAKARHLPVIALTDHLASPIAALSDAVLTVPEVDFGAFRAVSATLAMAMTLAVATGTARS